MDGSIASYHLSYQTKKELDLRISLAFLLISHKLGILSLCLRRNRSQIRKECGELISFVKAVILRAELCGFNI